MNDNRKTKAQLINELNELRQQLKRTGTSTDNVNHLELHAVRSILDASHGLIALLDRDGKIIECNQGMLDRFGKNQEELFGTSVWDNFPAEVTEKRKHMVAQVFETGEPAHIEDCSNGIWNHSIICPVFDNNDTVDYVLVHTVDITEQKETEQSLILHEKLLQNISGNIPGAVFEFIRDKNGSYFMNYMSEGAEKLFGLPLEKLTGPISSEFIHHDDIELFMNSIENSAENLSEWEHEYRFMKPDGTYKWLKGKSLPQKIYDGSIVWKGVLIDVTKEKEMEETLRQSEKRFRTMFENHKAVMLLIEPDSGAIWKANTAAAQFYGYSIDELCSMSINDINMLSSEEVFAKRQRAKLQKENSFVFPHKLRSGVIRTVEVHSTPIHYEGSTILFSIIHDITDRTLVEETLRKNEKLLKNAQEVAHLGHYQIDIKTGKAIWSDETFRIFGIDPSDGEPSVESYQELLHPDDAPKLYQLFNECINEKKPFDMVYRIFHSSGEIRYVHSVGCMETNPPDETAIMFGTLQDITERKLAEKTLALAHSRLQALWGIASLSDADLPTISDYALKAIVDMTDSPYGFLGFLNDDESVMTIHRWSGDAMKDCDMTQQPTDFTITECGVWAEAVRRRKPLLLNDYSVPHDAKRGVPKGHVELSRLLVIPIIMQNKIVSVAAVANRHSTYTDEDISQVTAFMSSIHNIIEERNTRKKLYTSEKALREAQRVAHLGNWEWNIKQNTLKWSDELYRIFGYEKDVCNEDLGDVLARSIHPDDLSEVERSNRSVIEDGKPIHLEYRIILPDGSVRTVLAEAGELILDEEGNPAVLSGIVQDITDHKRIQEQLEEREQYLSAILNTTVDSFWITNIFGKITEVNDAFCRISGYSRDELIGMGVGDLDIDETPEDTAQRIERIVTNGSEKFEARQRCKDGSILPLEISVSFLRQRGGQFVCFGRDLTERKKTEEQLRKSEELLNETGDLALVGGWDIDLETDEVYWTQTTRKIHEVPDDYRPTVETAVKYYPGESGKKIIDAVTAAREKGIPYDLELEFETYTGQKRFVRALGKPTFIDGKCVRLHGIFQDITERKIAEDRLKASEEKYRTLFENMLNGFALHEIVTDKTGNMVDYRILDVNPAYERIMGISRDEAVNALGSQVYGTGDAPWLDTFIKVAQDGETARFEAFFEPVQRYLDFTVSRPAEGMFSAVFTDITERKLAEEKIKISYDLLYNLSLLVPGVIYQYRLYPDGRSAFPYSSPGLYKIYEVTPEEVQHDATPVFGRLHPEDAARVSESIFESARTLETFYCEFRVVLPEQGLRWRWSQAEPQRTDDGGTLWHGIILDINERKEVELERERLSKAIEQSEEVIVITDPNGIILYVNPSFEKVTGYSYKEALGQNPRILKSEKQDDQFYCDLWYTISSGNTWKGRFVNKRKDGSYYTEEASISPVYSSSGDIVNYVAVKKDITEHIRMEEQFQQTQKLESIGQLAGGVAHDLNNLLTPIIGYGELLEEQSSLDEVQSESVNAILNAGFRAKDLVAQLLAFSRKQAMEFETLEINEVINSFKSLLNRTLRENVRLIFHLTPDIRNVLGDMGQIQQVVMNLAVNAADAMPEGGTLTIETAETRLDEEYVKSHPGVVPGDYIMLSVSDTGCGMDENTRKQIFEPFFSTKGEYGTGLGLSTVYGIVKQHSGSIWIYSEQGIGTTFKIYLPVSQNDSLKKTTAQESSTTHKGTETILLVEDNTQACLLARRVLAGQGYKVIEAHDSTEALHILESNDSTFHLLLTDVILPDMNGKELYSSCAELYPDIKVLFMSGYTDNVIAHHGVLDQGVPFIQKPFSIRALIAKVREVLDS